MEFCDAFSTEHLLAARPKEALNDELLEKYITYTGDLSTPPTLSDVFTFLECQVNGLPEGKVSRQQLKETKTEKTSNKSPKVSVMHVRMEEESEQELPF